MHSAREPRAAPDVTLRPMDPASFQAFLEALVPPYAAEHVAAGNWPAEGAEERAWAQTRELLPEGVATPGHELYEVVDADAGAAVGTLWLALREEDGRRDLFVYDIVVRPEWRRRGYARAALARAEQRGRALGADRLVLHVFGGNEGARSLYRTAGFDEIDVIMAKPLGAPEPVAP